MFITSKMALFHYPRYLHFPSPLRFCSHRHQKSVIAQYVRKITEPPYSLKKYSGTPSIRTITNGSKDFGRINGVAVLSRQAQIS